MMSTQLDTQLRPFPAFGRWLLRAVAAQPDKLTWKMLAERSGLSYSYLIQLKNGHERPTPRAIARLERALGLQFVPTPVAGLADTTQGGVTWLPVLAPVIGAPWLRDIGLQEAIATEQVPGPDAFFVLQADDGLMPSIPPQALCLTDPRQRHLTATATPMLVRQPGQAPIFRFAWRSAMGVHLGAGGWSSSEQRVDIAVPGSIDVLGQLVAVRFRLSATSLQDPTFV